MSAFSTKWSELRSTRSPGHTAETQHLIEPEGSLVEHHQGTGYHNPLPPDPLPEMLRIGAAGRDAGPGHHSAGLHVCARVIERWLDAASAQTPVPFQGRSGVHVYFVIEDGKASKCPPPATESL